jgi:hypothetical protein
MTYCILLSTLYSNLFLNYFKNMLSDRIMWEFGTYNLNMNTVQFISLVDIYEYVCRSGLLGIAENLKINLLFKYKIDFKGTVAWDFRSLALLIDRHQMGPSLPHLLYFFEFCFEFAELVESETCSALCDNAGNQIVFANTRNLKLGWCRPSLVLSHT